MRYAIILKNCKGVHNMRLKAFREDLDIRQLPIDALKKLSEYFDVSTDYILGITDIKTPYPKK